MLALFYEWMVDNEFAKDISVKTAEVIQVEDVDDVTAHMLMGAALAFNWSSSQGLYEEKGEELTINYLHGMHRLLIKPIKTEEV